MRVLPYLGELTVCTVAAIAKRLRLCTATPGSTLTVDTSRFEFSDQTKRLSEPCKSLSKLTLRRTPLEDRVYGGRPEDPSLHRRRPHAHIMEGLRAYACDFFVW